MGHVEIYEAPSPRPDDFLLDKTRTNLCRIVFADAHETSYVGNTVGSLAFRHRSEELQLSFAQAVHRRLKHHAIHIISGESHSLFHVFESNDPSLGCCRQAW